MGWNHQLVLHLVALFLLLSSFFSISLSDSYSSSHIFLEENGTLEDQFSVPKNAIFHSHDLLEQEQLGVCWNISTPWEI